ncbi:hypothetical protein FRB94_006925 [Tulasnella sp. JGI-2019a]|nr:hypothetical protein FRB94_006925 [Tulasnella sp. JGI-2019a]
MERTDVSREARKPLVLITIGMAGSGKTTFVQRLNSYLRSVPPRPSRPQSSETVPEISESGQPKDPGDSTQQPSASTSSSTSPSLPPEPRAPYILNLDPAVTHMPFEANIDIRDTIDYAEVMKQYNLGPNGGILTALNLFTTKFDQVLNLIEKRADSVDYVVLDTPGQIEIFTWSASGAIIMDAVAATFPTAVAYIIDTARTTAPATFMSNMLYACSILYKTKLPFILVFNKTDVQKHDFAIEWMQDFEAFQRALSTHGSRGGSGGGGGDGDPNYMDSLMHSMSLVLDEFYQHLKAVGVSAITGDGMPEFFKAVEEARGEYERDYLPELQRLQTERDSKLEATKRDSINRLMADMKVEEAERRASGLPTNRDRFPDEDEVMSEEDEGDNEEEDEKEGRFMDVTRARRVQDPSMEADGSRWPRPG